MLSFPGRLADTASLAAKPPSTPVAAKVACVAFTPCPTELMSPWAASLAAPDRDALLGCTGRACAESPPRPWEMLKVAAVSVGSWIAPGGGGGFPPAPLPEAAAAAEDAVPRLAAAAVLEACCWLAGGVRGGGGEGGVDSTCSCCTKGRGGGVVEDCASGGGQAWLTEAAVCSVLWGWRGVPGGGGPGCTWSRRGAGGGGGGLGLPM